MLAGSTVVPPALVPGSSSLEQRRGEEVAWPAEAHRWLTLAPKTTNTESNTVTLIICAYTPRSTKAVKSLEVIHFLLSRVTQRQVTKFGRLEQLKS